MANLFSQRSKEEEIMDDFSCSGEVLEQTLIEIDLINRTLGGDNITYKAVRAFLQKHKDVKDKEPLRIADLGCGSGGMLKLVSVLATMMEVPVDLVGIDANPNIIALAEEYTQGFPDIQFMSMDVFSEEFKAQKFDLVISSLTTHHFSDKQLVYLFKIIKGQSRYGFINNDLQRHGLAYYSIKLLTRLFSRSDMVKYDAPLSVLRGFRRKELVEILEEAGITDYELKWKWAFRWLLVF